MHYIWHEHWSRYPVKEFLTLPPTCSSHPAALCSSQCMSPRYIFIGHMTFYESPLSVTEFTRSRYATLFGFTTTNTMFYNITDAFRLLSSCARSTIKGTCCCVSTLVALPWPSLVIKKSNSFYIIIATKQTLHLFPRNQEHVFFSHYLHKDCNWIWSTFTHFRMAYFKNDMYNYKSIVIKINTLTCNDGENMNLMYGEKLL